MADYFPVLSRAVAGLPNNTGEARRAVYERARSAIVKQLRAIEPPLSEEDISRERMQLEEAIRKVEANAGGAPAAPAAAAKPAAPAPRQEPPRVERPAQPMASQPAPRPQPAAPRPQTPGPERAAPVDGDPSPAQRPPERRATRQDGRPIIRAADEPGGRGSGRKAGPLIALALLLALGVGGGLYAARGQIAGLFAGKNSDVAKNEPAPAASKTEDKTADAGKAPDAASKPDDSKPDGAKSDTGKSDDRLPQDGQAAAPPVQQPEPPAQPEQQASREPPPSVAPAPTPQQAPAPQTATAPAPSSGPLVAQRAVLYEEGQNQQSGEAVTGTIVWRTESVNGGQNQPLETAIRGDIDIPGRKLRASVTIRRNADQTLPASHTIEIQFNLPDDFANAGISNVPGVLMKADESARGAAVAGLSVRVTNGFFLIGLSNLDTERPVNEQLLRDRGWIDIPILYDNGRRAVLTLEKGTPGTQAFNDAFNSWRTATAGGQPQQQP